MKTPALLGILVAASLGLAAVVAVEGQTQSGETITISTIIAPTKYPGTGWPVKNGDIAGYELTCNGWGASYPPTTTAITLPSQCAEAPRWDIIAGMSGQAALDNGTGAILVSSSQRIKPTAIGVR